MRNPVKIGNVEIRGEGRPVFVAGPCVAEDYSVLEETAEFLKGLSRDYKIIMKIVSQFLNDLFVQPHETAKLTKKRIENKI